jgi:hypothetical protein
MRKFLAMALIAAVAATAHGMFLEEGTSEVSVSGQLNFDTANGTLTDVNLFYGYFLMDYFELGPVATYINDDAVQTWALGPKAEYNFDVGYTAVPFVGCSLLIASTEFKAADESDTAGVAGVEGGVKFFISEYAAISVALVGEIATEHIYSAKNGETDNTDARIDLGMRLFF